MGEQRHRVYVGIDVHSRTHKVAMTTFDFLDKSSIEWKKLTLFDIATCFNGFDKLDSEIKRYITRPSEAAIAVDHTGGHYSEPLIYFLQKKGYSVHNVEPKGIKELKDRLLDEQNKSDPIDAAAAAYLLYLRDIHGGSFRISATPFELGSKASLLQSLIIEGDQYAKRSTQVTNRLRQLLMSVFPEGQTKYSSKLLRICVMYPTPTEIVGSQDLKGVKRLSQADRESIVALAAQTVGVPGDNYRELIAYLAQERMGAKARLDAIKEIVQREVTVHPYGPILLSFPFLGPVAAATVIAVVKDIGRWSNKKKLKKAFGLYSTLKQSGTSRGTRRMGREGSRYARKVLFQAIMRCIRTNASDNDSKDYYYRQVAGGKPKLKAIVSTMGKLAEIIYHCLKTGEPYHYTGKYRC